MSMSYKVVVYLCVKAQLPMFATSNSEKEEIIYWELPFPPLVYNKLLPDFPHCFVQLSLPLFE